MKSKQIAILICALFLFTTSLFAGSRKVSHEIQTNEMKQCIQHFLNEIVKNNYVKRCWKEKFPEAIKYHNDGIQSELFNKCLPLYRPDKSSEKFRLKKINEYLDEFKPIANGPKRRWDKFEDIAYDTIQIILKKEVINRLKKIEPLFISNYKKAKSPEEKLTAFSYVLLLFYFKEVAKNPKGRMMDLIKRCNDDCYKYRFDDKDFSYSGMIKFLNSFTSLCNLYESASLVSNFYDYDPEELPENARTKTIELLHVSKKNILDWIIAAKPNSLKLPGFNTPLIGLYWYISGVTETKYRPIQDYSTTVQILQNIGQGKYLIDYGTVACLVLDNPNLIDGTWLRYLLVKKIGIYQYQSTLGMKTVEKLKAVYYSIGRY